MAAGNPTSTLARSANPTRNCCNESTAVEPLIGMETPGPSRPLDADSSRRGRRKNAQRGVASDSSATSSAMEENGRAAGEKVKFMKKLASEKVQKKCYSEREGSSQFVGNA